MYEVYYPLRDEWGEIRWVKWRSPSFFKRFQTAVKRCNKLGANSYVHKYGTAKAVYSSFTLPNSQ